MSFPRITIKGKTEYVKAEILDRLLRVIKEEGKTLCGDCWCGSCDPYYTSDRCARIKAAIALAEEDAK